jgi:hypothetical protein
MQTVVDIEKKKKKKAFKDFPILVLEGKCDLDG